MPTNMAPVPCGTGHACCGNCGHGQQMQMVAIGDGDGGGGDTRVVVMRWWVGIVKDDGGGG